MREKTILAKGVFYLLPFVFLASILWLGVSVPASAQAADSGEIARGKYLVRMGDCVACHTKPGGTQFAGGMYMPTPFGDLSVPNITPDKETGIGNWTDDQFYRAFHEGIGDKGEYLYPVFPFPWFTKVTKEDALAIKAYLFSLAPVHSPRAPLKLAFPANIRDSLLAWRTLFFTPATFKPDPSKSAEVNRGAYIVEGLGHCGECHNKRNIVGVSRWSGTLEGGQIDGWYAPNLTSDGQEGVGSWSVEQITTYLKTGGSPHKGVVLGPMKQAITDSLSYMTDSDLRAIAAYLKSFPAKETYTPQSPSDFKRPGGAGAEAYLTFCASCHQQNGQGLKGQFPALAGNGAVVAKGPENVLKVVLGGLTAQKNLAPMPAVGARMTDQQVADSINYVRNSWGNAAPAVTGGGDVAIVRAKTSTMLSGDPKACEPVDPKFDKHLESDGILKRLDEVTSENMLQTVHAILPKAKAAGPGLKRDGLVNNLTSAYCGTLPASASPADRSLLLGDFSMLVYGELRTNGHE